MDPLLLVRELVLHSPTELLESYTYCSKLDKIPEEVYLDVSCVMPNLWIKIGRLFKPQSNEHLILVINFLPFFQRHF